MGNGTFKMCDTSISYSTGTGLCAMRVHPLENTWVRVLGTRVPGYPGRNLLEFPEGYRFPNDLVTRVPGYPGTRVEKTNTRGTRVPGYQNFGDTGTRVRESPST
eukprot:2785304-Rhodomonas_salina.1